MLARQHPAQGHQQLVGRGVLHDVAARAGGQHALRVDQLVVHRQHEHRQVRMMGVHIAHQLQPIPLRERDIDDDHIRLQLADGGARFALALRLAADFEVRLQVDHQPQALPHDRVIVDDQHLARSAMPIDVLMAPAGRSSAPRRRRWRRSRS